MVRTVVPGLRPNEHYPRNRRAAAVRPRAVAPRRGDWLAAARRPDFERFGRPGTLNRSALEPRSDSGAGALDNSAKAEGNGRSRACNSPTIAGVSRCEATVLRDFQSAQTRQFMIGGSIVCCTLSGAWRLSANIVMCALTAYFKIHAQP